MAILEIHNWLNSSQSYREGVELYNKYGDNSTFKRMLSNGETAYTVTALKEKLLKLNQDIKPAAIPVTAESLPPADSELEKLKESWRAPYKEMAELHSQLKRATSEKRRKELAFAILDLEEKCRAIWFQIDNWGKAVVAPAPDQDGDLGPVELMKALSNARSNHSKAKKKGNSEKVLKYETLINELQERIKSL